MIPVTSGKALGYSVVIELYRHDGVLFYRGIVESPTRSGASRKAGKIAADSYCTVTNKVRLATREYWQAEDWRRPL